MIECFTYVIQQQELQVMNRFTEWLHSKGYLIEDFCDYWEVSRSTYERMSRTEKRKQKLTKMVDALPNRRGFRNNNPGNIVFRDDVEWLGQTGRDGNFVVFDTPEHGIRALARILRTYREINYLWSVSGIITRWAPPSENDTNAYIKFVADYADVEPYEKLDRGQYVELIEAIIHFENGSQPYDNKVVNAGFNLGFVGVF